MPEPSPSSHPASLLPAPRPVSTRRDDTLDSLLSAIRILPIPGERPTYAHTDEAAGLTFLELSLRMDHVRRVSENLALVDSTHMRREVSIDLDLRHITSRQRRALSIRPLGPMVDRAVRPMDGPGVDPRTADPGPLPDQGVGRLIWVPIARQSRGELASGDVRDNQNTVVVRLSSHAIRRALVSGLTRLFKTRLAASRRGAPPIDTDLELFARWLFEHAIAACVEQGLGRVPDSEAPDVVESRRPDSVDCDGEQLDPVGLSDQDIQRVRERARDLLTEFSEQELEEFLELLAMAAGEQLLAVLLPVEPSQVHLHYVAPPMPTDPRTTLWGRRLRSFLPVNREYTVEYETQLPRSIRSYHVSLAVPEEIKVRRCLLSADLDASAVAGLRADLRQLSASLVQRADPRSTAPWSAIWEAELSDVLTRVTELTRIRQTGLRRYRDYLRRSLAQYGGKPPAPGHSPETSPDPIEAFLAGSGDLSALLVLAELQEQGLLLTRVLDLSIVTIGSFLEALADYLTRYDVSYDIATDSDPRDNGANVHWRPQPLPYGPRHSEPIRVGLFFALADEPPALVESVARMILGLLAMVSFIAVPTILSHHFPSLSEVFLHHPDGAGNDALVAVLLLIPGILLSRLDIPSTHSILGELRSFPRRIAYASVIVTSLLALIAAVDQPQLPAWSTFTTALLVGFFGLCLLELVARGFRRRSLVPRSKFSPGWLVQAIAGNHSAYRRHAPVDAGFQAIGEPAPPEPHGRLALHRNHVIITVTQWIERFWSQFLFRRQKRSGSSSSPDSAAPVRAVEPGDDRAGATQPASVAARAARVAAERTTAVRFEVAHLPGHDSTFSERGGHGPHDTCSQMAEMLGFCAYGNTVEIRTQPVSEATAISARTDSGEIEVDPMDRYGVIRARSRYSPDFLQMVNGHDTEVLLSLGDNRDLSTAQAQMSTKVLYDVFDMMEDVALVPAFVVLPATPPTEVESLSARPVPRAELCLRIGVFKTVDPLSREGQDSRLEFETQLLEYARALGLGAWVSQYRTSTRPGKWRRICSLDQERYHEHRRAHFPGLPTDDHVTDVPADMKQASFILPYAPEVSSSLRELVGRFRADGIGSRSLIAWPLHQAMFVSMMMPVIDDRADPSRADQTDPSRISYDDLRRRCGRTWNPADPVAPEPPARLILSTHAEQPNREADSESWIATFWVAWDVPERGDVDAITKHLVSTFRAHLNAHRDTHRDENPDAHHDENPDAHHDENHDENRDGGQAWLVMLRARHNDRDHLRGRAKVMVRIPQNWPARQLWVLAQQVQHDVRLKTEMAFPWRNTAVDLTVTWGERFIKR